MILTNAYSSDSFSDFGEKDSILMDDSRKETVRQLVTSDVSLPFGSVRWRQDKRKRRHPSLKMPRRLHSRRLSQRLSMISSIHVQPAATQWPTYIDLPYSTNAPKTVPFQSWFTYFTLLLSTAIDDEWSYTIIIICRSKHFRYVFLKSSAT